ncbi:heme biosynthesis HemY N-terminal domain-containing protein [Thiolapillus sp.]
MKLLLQACLFLVLGGLAAWVVHRDPGYAFLAWGNWSLETSLAMLVILGAIALGLLYYLLRFILGLFHVPGTLAAWRQARRQRLARQQLTRGLLEFAEGHWDKAEKLLVGGAELSDTPLLNYLAAARAAQRQGAYERRDTYIRLAHRHMPTADVAVGLTQAELQLAHQQFEQALATLKHLREAAPRHTHVLRLLARLYEQLGDWEQLRQLLPDLRKAKTASPESLDALEQRLWRALLEEAGGALEASRLDTIWLKMPRQLHREPSIVVAYATQLHLRQLDEEAGELLRGLLKKHWSEEAVQLYGLLDMEDPAAALTTAESWLQGHELDPVLLLTLARLSLRDRLWGKARSYLEAAIANGAGLDARRELGHLLDALGYEKEAAEVYRQAVLALPGVQPAALPEHIPQGNLGDAGNREAVLPDLQEPVVES